MLKVWKCFFARSYMQIVLYILTIHIMAWKNSFFSLFCFYYTSPVNILDYRAICDILCCTHNGIMIFCTYVCIAYATYTLIKFLSFWFLYLNFLSVYACMFYAFKFVYTIFLPSFVAIFQNWIKRKGKTNVWFLFSIFLSISSFNHIQSVTFKLFRIQNKYLIIIFTFYSSIF